MAVCVFGNLGAIGFTGPDEPRYGWIARAMAETGDWVTPRLYGQPWFEKPILYYWAAAAGFLLHLPAEWAARLPSAFAALAAALIIGWLAKQHYGGALNSFSDPVLLAPSLFATSVAAIGFARAATPDMLFSASITAAMACVATEFRRAGVLRAAHPASAPESRPGFLPLLLFGASLGVGVLAKGPAAVVLAGGAVGIWGVATRDWRAALRIAHPVAVAAFCVIAIPWYALCAARNPDFLRVFIWEHNFERYATSMFQHRQPFWFFGPILLLALLPWTALLWPVAQEGLRLRHERSWLNSPGFFFACWVIWPVVFFSFSQSKLPGYILPAIPPLALLCATATARAADRVFARSFNVFAGIGLAWMVLGVAAARARFPLWVRFGRLSIAMALFAGFVLVLLGVALVAASYFRSPTRIMGFSVLLAAASVEVASLVVLPAIGPAVSARFHAEFMRNDQHPERIFTYQLSRGWVYGLNFYFHRELPEWSPSDPNAALVLTTPAGLQEMRQLGRVNGEIEQAQPGLVYAPVLPVPAAR